MARDEVEAREGAATVKVDNRDLARLANRITRGALQTFLEAAHRQMDPVVYTEAKAGWPVRSPIAWPGRPARSRDGLHIRDRVTPDEASVTAYNQWDYAYKVRFSVRTREGIDAEIEEAASRGTSGAAQAAIRRYWTRKLHKRHGVGAPSETLAGRNAWAVLVRGPARAREGAVIAEAREALDTLAGG